MILVDTSVWIDYFNGQKVLMPYCEQLNASRVSIPWLGNREMLFRFISKPTKAKMTTGHFVVNQKTAIYAQAGRPDVKKVAKYLSEQLRPASA